MFYNLDFNHVNCYGDNGRGRYKGYNNNSIWWWTFLMELFHKFLLSNLES